MTEPRHHIGDETLTAYAAGNLDRALSVVVASHLTLCLLEVLGCRLELLVASS